MTTKLSIESQKERILSALNENSDVTRPALHAMLKKLASRGTIDNRIREMVSDGVIVEEKNGGQAAVYRVANGKPVAPQVAKVAPLAAVSDGIELVIRQAKIASLNDYRARLASELAEVDSQIGELV